ncbi:ABC transporter F family member 4-like [Arachis ipaensis]|uniref:ABC transporter F family member 4-like n=1 Tax=Arachis ipaensis TaxID=130454 RepID=UPI0007AF2AC1|nr:ABC transporter F family member 4-like [Arachis ipaensis]
MAKRINSLQVASVNVTNQPPTGWGQSEENCEDQQQEQVNYMHNQGSTNKKSKENDKKPAEKEEANNKEEMTASKKDKEKLKEKDDQPQNLREGKQVMEGPSQGQKQLEKAFTPPMPYPQWFNKETKDQHFPKTKKIKKKTKKKEQALS